jgi:FtsP/CotA-like multicopper oxidase with cupredoxin domain
MKHQEWVKRTSVTLAVLLAISPAAQAAAPRDAASRTGVRAQAPKRVDLTGKVARVQQQRQKRITQADRAAAAQRLEEQRQKIEAARATLGTTATSTRTTTTQKTMSFGAVTPAAGALPYDPIPTGPAPGAVPDYYTTPNWAFSPPLRKFIDSLPGLGPSGASTLDGYYLPVAVADTKTYPGSDYYEIELREYQHRFHRELNETTLRGYVQVNPGTDANGNNTVAPPPISYLGPVIVSERDRPVRIKFTNKLPAGEGGDLEIPVDESIMGAGQGPLYPNGSDCDNTADGSTCAKFPQNRAAIHLHGGRTPWISDGTPFQWVTPADEQTPYPKGVSLENVPDMPDPGPGSTTYYYSNQQSARLMFYHDHAWGITRLNVLVGEAAGYLITDQHERKLVDDGVIPAEQIPLIIQDRTFVDADVIRDTDPLWNWGTGAKDANGVAAPNTGDLWIPHVYMPAENPADLGGMAAMGRWVYGPWFWPPTTDIKYPPIANPHYDPRCSDPDPAVYALCETPGQAPLIPATPSPSVGMETFFDTQTVNGVAFPYLEVDPRAYRFRVLNASNDRFVNLSIYEADGSQVASDGRQATEIRMVDATVKNWDPNLFPLWPGDGREGGVPDPTKAGPPVIQIGTEGGFLPRPVVIPAQPIGYFTDPTAFNFGNVKDKALALGPAERADVVIDFSRYAGKTLILYNDAPTAFPALDIRTDFYAGNPDYSDVGGYGRVPPGSTTGAKEGVQVGYGPNTRTVMQIRVKDVAPAPEFSVANLQQAFAPDATTGKKGVFETAQEPIIVGQAGFNGVYSNVTFPSNWPYWGIAGIHDDKISFKTVAGNLIKDLPMEPKGIHDEMGASFDPEYGRMSGNLGVEFPKVGNNIQNFTLYDFTDPSTEIVFENITPPLGDGTQLWKISHNGVDTHPIHFHIFDVQLVNRVGWDGGIRLPDPNEMGWKDTIRISPLEDTIVAMRPKPPALPFNIPDSYRPLNPGIPLHSTMGFTNTDPITHQAITPPVTNEIVNYAWEYVWHCHILSHEEMDMMRPIILNVQSIVPPAPGGLAAVANAGPVTLTWSDPTPVNYVTQVGFGLKTAEIGFRIERALGTSGQFQPVGSALANATSFVDGTAVDGLQYRYRVVAYNEAGATASNEVSVNSPPVAGVSPTAVAFGYGQVGVATATKRVTVSNTGLGQLLVGAISISGTNAADFTQTNTCGGAVPSNGTCAIDVTFKTGAPGARTASLAIPTNDPVGPTVTVGLQGTGVAVTLTASAPSPGNVGVPVQFTASAQGVTGAQYRFWFSNNNGATYTVVKDWNSTNTWTLDGTYPAANYRIVADARVDTTSNTRIAYATALFTLTSVAPATGVTLTTNLSSPQLVGTPVTFIAAGQGSTSPYQYRFQLSTNNGATYTVVQNWGDAASWTLNTAVAGNYRVLAEVKTNATSTTRDAYTSLIFTMSTYAKATGVTLVASPKSPSAVGTPVLFTATGQGSTNYHYRFSVSTNNRATWTQVQSWGSSNTYTLPGTYAAGTVWVLAEVKADPLSLTRDAWTSLNQSLQ